MWATPFRPRSWAPAGRAFRHGRAIRLRRVSHAPRVVRTCVRGAEDEDPAERARPGVPAGRLGDAREVAHLIAHLASPEASYTTGASYVIDGGMLLMAAQANLIAQA